MLFRCPQCRTRRRDWGLFTQHLKSTGHRACDCGGYHYRHRPGSPLCVDNPLAPLLDAKRRGADRDTLLDIHIEIAWEKGGAVFSTEPPF